MVEEPSGDALLDPDALDRALAVLVDRRVRYVLSYLAENETTTVEDLADVVAGREAVAAGTIVSPTDHDRIRLRLHHSVLPRLDEAEYVDFEPETGTVTRLERPPSLDRLLEAWG